MKNGVYYLPICFRSNIEHILHRKVQTCASFRCVHRWNVCADFSAVCQGLTKGVKKESGQLSYKKTMGERVFCKRCLNDLKASKSGGKPPMWGEGVQLHARPRVAPSVFFSSTPRPPPPISRSHTTRIGVVLTNLKPPLLQLCQSKFQNYSFENFNGPFVFGENG